MVLIADDDLLVAECINMCLQQAGLEVAGVARDGFEAIELVPELSPDVLLLDFRMPDKDGAAVLLEISRTAPNVRVIVYSGWASPIDLARSIVLGAHGFLTKDIAPQHLIRTIRKVLTRPDPYSPRIVKAAVDVLGQRFANLTKALGNDGVLVEPLSSQELRVATLLAEGLNNPEIAGVLGLSESTVKSHIHSTLQKLRMTNKTGVVVFLHQYSAQLESVT